MAKIEKYKDQMKINKTVLHISIRLTGECVYNFYSIIYFLLILFGIPRGSGEVAMLEAMKVTLQDIEWTKTSFNSASKGTLRIGLFNSRIVFKNKNSIKR